MSAPIPSSQAPLAGLWRPLKLERLFYGPSGTVEKYLLQSLPSQTSKVFIVTGNSLATKTPLVKSVEGLLGERHAGTFSHVKAHAPIAELNKAVEIIQGTQDVDTILSIGGGSPIDTAKNVSYLLHRESRDFLYHITIPTTLSAAETTWIGGFTKPDGLKGIYIDPELSPKVVIYDAGFAKYTPEKLWLSTGLRALDHAVEMMYHPSATEMPCRTSSIASVHTLFQNLGKSDEISITKLQLAAFQSLGFLGYNLLGGLGLSHALGYALGSPYGIGHGVTSCLTLGKVVKLKAELNYEDAVQVARLLPVISTQPETDAVSDAIKVGSLIESLVEHLGLKTTLTECGVGAGQISVITDAAIGAMKAAAGGKDVEERVKQKVEALVKSLY